MWFIDQYGFVMDSTEYTNLSCSDAVWRSAIWSIMNDDPRPLRTALSYVLFTKPEDWIRHPKVPDSVLWGTYSRDQLIMLTAACKHFGMQKAIECLDQKIGLFNKIGNKFRSTFWLKAWFWLLTRQKDILAVPLFMLYVALDSLWWSITKKNAFNRHLCAWAIHSLDKSTFKSICWGLFNFSYNTVPWMTKIEDNDLYAVMQQRLPEDWSPYTDGVEYPWQEGQERPTWLEPQRLDEHSPCNAIITSLRKLYD